MYVMFCTRPDLSTAVNIFSRYLTKNNKELRKCLKRVLRYLKGSVELKLTYIRGDYNDLLSGFVDSEGGGGGVVAMRMIERVPRVTYSYYLSNPQYAGIQRGRHQ